MREQPHFHQPATRQPIIQIGGDHVEVKRIGSTRRTSNGFSAGVVNPYMPGRGIDKVTLADIADIEDQLKKVYILNRRRDKLMKWSRGMKKGLENGLWSDDQMMVVQSYFTDQIMINRSRMDKYRAKLQKNLQGLRMDQYLEQKEQVDNIEEVYNNKVWAQYQRVGARNGKKTEALRTLSEHTCKMAGYNWTQECDDLLTFFEGRDQKLAVMRRNYTARLDELYSNLKSETEMKYQLDYQVKSISQNNKESIAKQVTIRENYKGQERDFRLQEEVKRSSLVNQGMWHLWQTIEKRNREK